MKMVGKYVFGLAWRSALALAVVYGLSCVGFQVSVCLFLMALFFLYRSWTNFQDGNGVPPRFLDPGGYTNSLVTDSNIRDSSYGERSKSAMENADSNALIMNLICAVIFVVLGFVA